MKQALDGLRRNIAHLTRDFRILWVELWIAVFVLALGLLLAVAIILSERRP